MIDFESEIFHARGIRYFELSVSMDRSEHQETRGRLIWLAGDPMSSNAKKRIEERIDKSMRMWMWACLAF